MVTIKPTFNHECATPPTFWPRKMTMAEANSGRQRSSRSNARCGNNEAKVAGSLRVTAYRAASALLFKRENGGSHHFLVNSTHGNAALFGAFAHGRLRTTTTTA